MKTAKNWELWKWCIWSFRGRASFSNGWTDWSQLRSRASAHELLALAVDWSLRRGQMMYYLSSPAVRGEPMGLYVRVTVWGYFIPAFFLHKCAMLNSRICPCVLTLVPSLWQIAPSRGPSLSEETSKKVRRRNLGESCVWVCTFILLRFWDFLTLNCQRMSPSRLSSRRLLLCCAKNISHQREIKAL